LRVAIDFVGDPVVKWDDVAINRNFPAMFSPIDRHDKNAGLSGGNFCPDLRYGVTGPDLGNRNVPVPDDKIELNIG